MANEEQIETLFIDCEPGAVPALGAAYGLKVIVDDSLAKEPEVFLEGGDHAEFGSRQRQHISAAIGRCPPCSIH